MSTLKFRITVFIGNMLIQIGQETWAYIQATRQMDKRGASTYEATPLLMSQVARTETAGEDHVCSTEEVAEDSAFNVFVSKKRLIKPDALFVPDLMNEDGKIHLSGLQYLPEFMHCDHNMVAMVGKRQAQLPEREERHIALAHASPGQSSTVIPSPIEVVSVVSLEAGQVCNCRHLIYIHRELAYIYLTGILHPSDHTLYCS